MRRGSWRAALLALLVVGGLLGAAHATAPAARAECDGGLDFAATAASSQAAVVGRVVSLRRHANGFTDVTAVRVEHASGVSTGAVFYGRAVAGWCPDAPRAGSLVVILVGTRQEVRGSRQVYFVVTQSITFAQAASVGSQLPDTSAATPVALPAHASAEPFLPVVAGGISFLLMLRRRRSGRATRARP